MERTILPKEQIRLEVHLLPVIEYLLTHVLLIVNAILSLMFRPIEIGIQLGYTGHILFLAIAMYFASKIIHVDHRDSISIVLALLGGVLSLLLFQIILPPALYLAGLSTWNDYLQGINNLSWSLIPLFISSIIPFLIPAFGIWILFVLLQRTRQHKTLQLSITK